MINIALADDESLFLDTLSFMLQRIPDFNVVFTATNGQDLVNQLSTQSPLPDVVVTDLKMPELNGVEATKKIKELFPELSVIALSSYNTDVFISNMLGVGAASYLVKNTTPAQVELTIREVAAKGFYYDKNVLRILQDNSQDGNYKRSTLDHNLLTPRELDVLQLICEQFTTAEIGEQLCVSKRTVDGHRNNLLVKTKMRNVAGLVAYAIQNAIITVKI
ncbi:response regulator [Nonlabens ulvanivorans]|uniref:LuxR family transcriptional regulator n=1 Tax=Nonlabens ulvanivorans TaxID=906888 RepID=A0A084JX47_NONUL|nr:response regulator transcription factor [Nonlabens ulvanivorans]KEZ93531.1 LuxR family transcriptional regulator [Nonlabens ulvanivorans]PRX14107.1 LuxR family two component transcriptional regulator [Nonlabens ulvanivorans]